MNSPDELTVNANRARRAHAADPRTRHGNCIGETSRRSLSLRWCSTSPAKKPIGHRPHLRLPGRAASFRVLTGWSEPAGPGKVAFLFAGIAENFRKLAQGPEILRSRQSLAIFFPPSNPYVDMWHTEAVESASALLSRIFVSAIPMTAACPRALRDLRPSVYGRESSSFRESFL